MGGGPNPEDFDKPKPTEQALASIGLDKWLQYTRKYQPVIAENVAEVGSDMVTATRGRTASGMMAGDAAQRSAGMPMVMPGKGITAAPKLAKASVLTDAAFTGATGAKAQQAASLQGMVDSAMGKDAHVASGMYDLAKSELTRGINTAENDYNSSATRNRSLMGLGGMALQTAMGGKTS